MLSWIKQHALVLSITTIATLFAATSFLFMLWRGAEAEADAAKKVAEAYREVIETQSRISENEQSVDRTTVEIVQRVLEAPNANVLVPPDVASAWADGIDRLRDDAFGADERDAELSGPPSNSSAKGRPDSGAASSSLRGTGSRVPKVQLSSRASIKPNW